MSFAKNPEKSNVARIPLLSENEGDNKIKTCIIKLVW